MITIGISGGIASGKSTVVERFKFHGAVAIHADPIVHNVVALPEIVEQVRAAWRIDMDKSSSTYGMTRSDRFPSTCVLTNEGVLSRPAVARLVFDYTDELGFLERITYPLVDARIKELVKLFDNGFHNALVLDIPLMFEYEYDELCQHLAFVDCDFDKRVARYAKRISASESLARKDIELREKRLLPLSNKKQFSKVHFDNNGTQEELISQVDHFWSKLVEQKFSHAFAQTAYHRHPNVE